LLARKRFVEQLFRATQAAGHAPNNEPAAARTAVSDAQATTASAANAPLQRAMTHTGRGGVRFDSANWLARYNTSPTAKPGLSTNSQLQHAVLPLPPGHAIATDSTRARISKRC
jgi:hypothetical protein